MNRPLKDMTTGSPLRLLIAFSLPLIFANVFQQLYTVVDTAIVGQGVGLDALAALGAADWFYWMMLSAVQGVTAGFAIRLSQQFGARDEDGLRRTVAASAVLAVLAAAALTALSELLVLPVLGFLRTPADILPGAALYLRVMFGGLPVTMLFNLTASVLRSLGDSRTPLYATILASVLNVGLDLLFVFPLRWGIAGAAIASVLAQGAASLVNLARLRALPLLRLSRADFDGWRGLGLPLLRLGLPLAAQNMVTAAGGMAVQAVVNGFGALYIAGFTATNKLYGLLEIASISYGYAVSTYAGQNYGAGDRRRIRRGVRAATALSCATALVLAAALLAGGHVFVGLFISPENPADATAALAIALHYLRIMCLWLPALYLIFVFRSALQGLGRVMAPMLSGVLETVLRVGVAFLAVPLWQEAIFYCEVTAWAGAALLNLGAYLWLLRRWRIEEVTR